MTLYQKISKVRRVAILKIIFNQRQNNYIRNLKPIVNAIVNQEKKEKKTTKNCEDTFDPS